MSPARIYLDNAATSWPKPPAVYDAVDRYQREIGVPAGRGSHGAAVEAARVATAARDGVARLIGAKDPRSVVFTASGTDALNLALFGLLQAGDRVVTTVCEHNSVLRPLHALAESRGVRIETLGCDAQGVVDPDDFRKALAEPTRLVAVTHASNVTGAVQPVAEIARLAHERGALVLVDAAQTLGWLPLDVGELGADLLAAPGHKGLMGPLGTGLLWLADGLAAHVTPLRHGGTGAHSESPRQPDTLPERFEAGCLNMPGVAGLAAGVAELLGAEGPRLRSQSEAAHRRLLAGLQATEGVRLLGAGAPQRVGVVSLVASGYDPQELAMTLEVAAGVECRAGLHCAPRLHEALGTASQGGTLRLSPGPWTTDAQLDTTLAALAGLMAAAAS
ncbi:putative cysteine desulfurase [Pseudobythopirellula maris]|uniref:cysteine desulfurase n=1 Tax=Pseudobythopirellula maris TaxID=2527991 RepID=A0A5C5ZSH3_9BACT|nr:aminotransferase class V-fold PLP-dependent enzyme [Pseudobythopirellula maris]TWT90459.1 putative cysteine desulfurase [Pseudobythopirellula maris]